MIPLVLAGLGVAVTLVLSSQEPLGIVRAARDAIFEELRDGLFVLDARGRLADLNRIAERIVGRAAADMLGRPAAELFAGRLQPVLDSIEATADDREVELASDSDTR